MAENKKYYHITYIKLGDQLGSYRTDIIDIDPVEFVIKGGYKTFILYSEKITREQLDRYAEAIRNVNND